MKVAKKKKASEKKRGRKLGGGVSLKSRRKSAREIFGSK